MEPAWVIRAIVAMVVLQVMIILFQWYEISRFNQDFRRHLRIVISGGWNAAETEFYVGVIRAPFWSMVFIVPLIAVLAFWRGQRWWILAAVLLGLICLFSAAHAWGLAIDATD